MPAPSSRTRLVTSPDGCSRKRGSKGSHAATRKCPSCTRTSSSIAAGQRRRIREAVILKSLGATRAQIRTTWLIEFGTVGAAAGVIAAAVGTAASYGVVRFIMDTEWSFLPGTLAATVAGCVALMLIFGYAGTAVALRAKAAPLLRNE